jgi:GT2 family glycosyltransferase
MNLSVIIPNFNGGEILEKNLSKVLAQLKTYTAGKVELIVVDDGSEDNSLEVLNKFPQVEVYKNPKNMGFSFTVNKGVSFAKGDILLLLNTDVYPDNGFLTPLLEHFKDEKVFAVGCMDKSVEGKETILRGRGIGTWQRGFLVHARGEVDKSDTLWVSGGSGAFRKTIWDKLGGLNELYNPFYWEDIDLSYRGQKSGYKVLFEAESMVTHEHEKGAIKRKFSSFDVKVISYRNQFFFAWTNLTDVDLLIRHFIWLPYHFINTLIKGDFAFTLGFFRSLIYIPKVIKSRIDNKLVFIRKDREVVSLYQK